MANINPTFVVALRFAMESRNAREVRTNVRTAPLVLFRLTNFL